MAIGGGPIVPKAVYYRVSVHKALQGLLREPDVSLVPDEEGAASLVVVTDSSCRDHSMGSNVVEDDAHKAILAEVVLQSSRLCQLYFSPSQTLSNTYVIIGFSGAPAAAACTLHK
jgi:hypothetical protein